MFQLNVQIKNKLKKIGFSYCEKCIDRNWWNMECWRKKMMKQEKEKFFKVRKMRAFHASETDTFRLIPLNELFM